MSRAEQEVRFGMTGCVRLALAIHIHQPIGNFEGVFESAYQR